MIRIGNTCVSSSMILMIVALLLIGGMAIATLMKNTANDVEPPKL